LKRELLVSSELDRLKKRVNEDIPAELKSKIDAMTKNISEDIAGECNKLKQSITEETLTEFNSLKSRLDLL
jgi:hypothetical protein